LYKAVFYKKEGARERKFLGRGEKNTGRGGAITGGEKAASFNLIGKKRRGCGKILRRGTPTERLE